MSTKITIHDELIKDFSPSFDHPVSFTVWSKPVQLLRDDYTINIVNLSSRLKDRMKTLYKAEIW